MMDENFNRKYFFEVLTLLIFDLTKKIRKDWKNASNEGPSLPNLIYLRKNVILFAKHLFGGLVKYV